MSDNIICICTDKIPLHRFEQFNEILCACGGRYVSKPAYCFDSVWVEYKFIDGVGFGYVEFCNRWNKLQLQIVEKRSGFFIKFWRRIKGILK